MKALLILAGTVLAGISYAGYSYSSTDGQSCLVCPMTGKPIFTSSSDGGTCANKDEDTLQTSASAKCSGQCDKGCCKDQVDTVDDNSGT